MKINKLRADHYRLSRGDRAGYFTHSGEIETVFATLNSLSEGIIITNKDGKCIFSNPMANNILGIGSKNITPETWTSLCGWYSPDKLTPYPLHKFPLLPATNGGRIHDERIFIKNPWNPDGRYISIDASPVRNAHGSITGGSIVIRDISETIASEKFLNESRERLSTQFKGFPQPTYVWQNTGDDFILIDYNHAAKKFNHGSIEKYLGIKLSRMYADSPEILADFKACLDKKSVLNREMNYAFKNDRKQRDWIVNYVFLPPDSIMVHTEDITERKNNERELRKLSSAIEQTADSVLLTDKNGIIEYVNPAFEKTTGFTSAEVIGKTPAVLKSGHHDINFYKTIWEVILGGNPYSGTILNRKKDGRSYWCEQSITPMKNEKGIITNFVSVIKDISELKKKQEQDFYLNVAQEVQQRLSNAKFSAPGFDIAGATHSALETSGDYFDFLHTADDHILLVAGDMSGHGIGAALIMAETRAFLRAFAKTDSDPAKILKMLNEELLLDLDDKNYVTLFIARISPFRNILDYASAGHIPAYLVDYNGRVKHILNSTGIPLGFISGEEFLRSEQIVLEPGNILALLTDGITEARANDESEFGYNRTLDVINSHRMDTAQQITGHLTRSVCAFTGLQHQEDDITAVICKVN